VLDEDDALLGVAFEIETLGETARVEPVVGEREALVEERLAEATREVAALFQERQRAERAETEVPEKLRERIGLEHRGVRSRLDLDRALRPSGLLSASSVTAAGSSSPALQALASA